LLFLISALFVKWSLMSASEKQNILRLSVWPTMSIDVPYNHIIYSSRCRRRPKERKSERKKFGSRDVTGEAIIARGNQLTMIPRPPRRDRKKTAFRCSTTLINSPFALHEKPKCMASSFAASFSYILESRLRKMKNSSHFV
jgi:hypothetical protein